MKKIPEALDYSYPAPSKLPIGIAVLELIAANAENIESYELSNGLTEIKLNIKLSARKDLGDLENEKNNQN